MPTRSNYRDNSMVNSMAKIVVMKDNGNKWGNLLEFVLKP